jgi:hypothetical protein
MDFIARIMREFILAGEQILDNRHQIRLDTAKSDG